MDAHVGKHLFQKCIREYLKDSAVILVTHQLQYLREADLIVVLKHGRIQEKGDFQYLVTNGLDFSAFLSMEKREENDSGIVETGEEVAGLEEDKLEDKVIRDEEVLSRRGKRSRGMSLSSEFSQLSAGGLQEIDAYADMGTSAGQPEDTKEEKSAGNIDRTVYLRYFRAGSNWVAVVYLVLISICCQVLFSISDVWLGYWTNQELEIVTVEESELPPPSILPQNTTARSICNILHS